MLQHRSPLATSLYLQFSTLFLPFKYPYYLFLVSFLSLPTSSLNQCVLLLPSHTEEILCCIALLTESASWLSCPCIVYAYWTYRGKGVTFATCSTTIRWPIVGVNLVNTSARTEFCWRGKHWKSLTLGLPQGPSELPVKDFGDCWGIIYTLVGICKSVAQVTYQKMKFS